MNIPVEDTFFEVHEYPIGFKDPLGQEVQGNSTGFKAIARTNPNQVLDIVSSNYKVVTNEEVFMSIKQHTDRIGAKLVNVDMFANKRASYTFQLPDSVDVSGQEVLPRIMVKNSYDRSTSVDILAGAFVLVCSNGMVIGKTTTMKKYKHLEGTKALDSLPDIFEKVTMDFTDEFVPLLNEMDQREINQEHLLELYKWFPQQMHDVLTDTLKRSRPKTFWQLLNVATYVLTHHSDRDKEATHKLERVVTNRISKLMN